MIKFCKYCGKEYKLKPSHFNKSSYCSRNCMSKDYEKRLVGAENPNYKNNNNKICQICNKAYKSYDKKNKFCSHSCAGRSIDNRNKLLAISHLPKKPRIKKIKEKVEKQCVICSKKFKTINAQTCSKECMNKLKSLKTKKEKTDNKICEYCGSSYHSYEKRRKYCSHNCSYKDGSSIRGGQNSIMAVKKYGAKKDANHNLIQSYFIDAGLTVKDLSSVGFGMPDLIIWDGKEWILVEIKNPKTAYGRRGLNKVQTKWIEGWNGGKIFVISNLVEAKLFVQKKYHLLNQYPK